MDELLIYADMLSNKIIDALKYTGVKLNKDVFFGVTRIKFLSHILSEDGLSVDPEKVSAIKDLKYL